MQAMPGQMPCGDWLKKALDKFGADRIQRWLKKLGIDCHCPERQEAMNKACARLRRLFRV